MAGKLTFLYLSEPDVLQAGLTLSDSVDLCTQSLTEHGLKEVENPPKPGIHTLPDSFIHAMPAWLKQTNACGIKWVSGYPSNGSKKLPAVAGLIVLNDTTTGLPLAVMDGTYITALRTCAVSGVSAKHFARKDSQVLAVVGTGVQGKYNTLVLTNILPSIKTVKIFDVWKPSIDRFVQEMTPVLESRGVKIEITESSEQALTGADVIVTATGKLLEPIFFEKWVKPGALILPIHTGGWGKDTLAKMDMVVVDDWSQFFTFAESIYTVPDSPDAELGEVVAGIKPGRQNDQQRIINFNVGLAIHDIIFAKKVFEIAKAKGLGTTLDFIDLSVPIPLPPM